MKTAGYQIRDRDGTPVSVTLPDRWRAENAAVQNNGSFKEMVLREDVDHLIAAHEAGMALLRDQLGLQVHPGAGM